MGSFQKRAWFLGEALPLCPLTFPGWCNLCRTAWRGDAAVSTLLVDREQQALHQPHWHPSALFHPCPRIVGPLAMSSSQKKSAVFTSQVTTSEVPVTMSIMLLFKKGN